MSLHPRRGLAAALAIAVLADWFEDHRSGVATTAEFDDALREWAPIGFDVDDFLGYARLSATP